MKNKIIIGIILLSLIFVVGCAQEEPVQQQYGLGELDYVLGEVVVGFAEGMDKIEAQSIIDSYELELKSWSPRDFTTINVIVNEEDISVIEDHERISSLEQIEGNEYTIYFYIEDFINLKHSEVEEILSGFDVEIIEDEHYTEVMSVDWGVLIVPEGSEVGWVNTLQQDSNFKYVELNYLVELEDE